MGALTSLPTDDGSGHEDSVFQQIADGLRAQSWCVVPDALPPKLAAQLFEHVRVADISRFSRAGVGRSSDHVHNPFVRRDRIRWIDGSAGVEQQWLAWSGRLQTFLNLLGLFSFESHFAHYQPGDFYKKNVDAGEQVVHRMLPAYGTVVAFLSTEVAHEVLPAALAFCA